MKNDPEQIQQAVMDIHLFVKLLDQVCCRMERLTVNLNLGKEQLRLLIKQKNILVFFDALLGELEELTQSLDKMIEISPSKKEGS